MSLRWLDIEKKGNWRRRRGQDDPHRIERRGYELIVIEGNRDGLTALRYAIDRALSSIDGDAECSQYDIIGGPIKVVVRARDLSEKTEAGRQNR